MLVLKDTGEGCHLVKYLVPHTLQPNEIEVTGPLPEDPQYLKITEGVLEVDPILILQKYVDLGNENEVETQAYQDKYMSVNESKALLGASLAGAQLGEKASTNLLWLSLVWACYDKSIVDDTAVDFSEVPTKLYSFRDLQAEAGL